MTGLLDHAVDGRPHEERLVEERRELQSSGRPRERRGRHGLDTDTMSSVLALPFLSTDMSTERLPPTRTMLVCGA